MTRQSGYSVFEVLVAFAIMALVLSALLPGQGRLLARATSGDNAVLAHDFALSRLAVLTVAEPLTPGTTTTDDGKWRAIQTVIVADTTEDTTTYDVIVIVQDENGRELARAVTQKRVAND